MESPSQLSFQKKPEPKNGSVIGLAPRARYSWSKSHEHMAALWRHLERTPNENFFNLN